MDLNILKWVDATFHSQIWLNRLMKYITFIGEFGLGSIITALVLIIIPKTRWGGVGAALALIVDVLLVNVILKLAVNRARPWTAYPQFSEFYESCGVRVPRDSSFPSGHAASCFATAVFLLLRYKIKGLPAVIVAALVALSRIYLCVHYPTDVLGGVLIGSACGVAGYFLEKAVKKLFYKKIVPRFAKNPSPQLSREEIIEQMYDKDLNDEDILKVIYSPDKTRRFIICKTDGYVTYYFETLCFEDVYGETSAYWTPYFGGTKSIYATLEEAEKQLVFEPEYLAYFK